MVILQSIKLLEKKLDVRDTEKGAGIVSGMRGITVRRDYKNGTKV
jgi:hypothetical protein